MGFLTEKEKAKLEHKFKIRQIILDKALWAVVVIILGITANVVFEKYKADLTSDRFFLEKKYDAALAIQEAFSNLHIQFEKFTVIDKRSVLPEDYLEIYADSLYDFVKISNKSGLWFSENFRESTQYFIFVFSGFNQKDVSKCRKYREFASDVGGWFMDTLLTEFGFKSTYREGDYQFKGIEPELAHEVDRELGTDRFLDSEFEKWKKWRKNHEKK